MLRRLRVCWPASRRNGHFLMSSWKVEFWVGNIMSMMMNTIEIIDWS
jgi:hypothetical protein